MDSLHRSSGMWMETMYMASFPPARLSARPYHIIFGLAPRNPCLRLQGAHAHRRKNRLARTHGSIDKPTRLRVYSGHFRSIIIPQRCFSPCLDAGSSLPSPWPVKGVIRGACPLLRDLAPSRRWGSSPNVKRHAYEAFEVLKTGGVVILPTNRRRVRDHVQQR